MPIINTDNQLLQDTINQRGHQIFTPLAIVNGVLNFPPGTIINALSASLLLDGNFLDRLTGANIVQGRSLTPANTLPSDASGPVYRSLLVSSRLASISAGGYTTILSSASSTIDSLDPTDFTRIELSGIYDSDAATITRGAGSTGFVKNGTIIGSVTAGLTLNAASTADITSSGVFNSSGSGVVGNVGDIASCSVLGSISSVISTAAAATGLLTGAGIFDSLSCLITSGGSGNSARDTILSSQLCALATAAASTGLVTNSGIFTSLSSTVTASGSGTIDKTSIINSDTCTLSSTGDIDTCLILDGRSSTLSTTSTGDLETSAVINSASSTLRSQGSGTCSQNTILSSATSDLSTAAASTGTITNSGILTSSASTMTASGAGTIDKSAIINADTCTLTSTDNMDYCTVLGSRTSNLTATSTGDSQGNSIFSSIASALTVAGTGNCSYNNIIGSDTCTLATAGGSSGLVEGSGIYNSQSSSITQSGAGSVDKSGILATDTCTINSTGNLDTCTVIASRLSNVNVTSTASTENCSVFNSVSSDVTASSTGATVSNGVFNSVTSGISSGGSGSVVRNTVLGSTICTISTAGGSTGGVATTGIIGSSSSSITESAGGTIDKTTMIGSDLCTITSTGNMDSCLLAGSRSSNITQTSTGPAESLFILNSTSSTVTSDGTNSFLDVGIVGSNTCTITNAATAVGTCHSCGFYGCRTSNMTHQGDNSFVSSGGLFSGNITTIQDTAGTTGSLEQFGVIATDTATITKTANGTHECCATLGCTTATLTNTNTTVAAGASSPNAVSTTSCFLSGTAPTVSGFTNVLCHGATATASNQAIFGTNLVVSGGTNSIDSISGYVRGGRGFIGQAVNTAIAATLAETHNFLHLSVATAETITIPTAASLATYPSSSFRSFLINQIVSATPGKLLLSGGDLFRNKTGWTELQLPRSRAPLELLWVNTGTPYWTFATPINLEATANMTTADNFGVGPPQANASILPTAANKAAHEALTTTAYITYNTLVSDNPTTFTVAGAVFTLPHTGWYRVKYGFNIRQTAAVPAATGYTLRTDVHNITAAAPVGNSYAEFAGMNDLSGTRYVEVTTDKFLITASTQIAVRISQDTANTIAATANVIFSKLIIEAEI